MTLTLVSMSTLSPGLRVLRIRTPRDRPTDTSRRLPVTDLAHSGPSALLRPATIRPLLLELDLDLDNPGLQSTATVTTTPTATATAIVNMLLTSNQKHVRHRSTWTRTPAAAVTLPRPLTLD